MTATVTSNGWTSATGASLSPRRVALLRAAYGFVGVGLVVTRWPQVADAHALPRYDGVVLVMLTAMSVLMLLGLRHPVRMLPVLVFESLWKLIWLATVALPLAASGARRRVHPDAGRLPLHRAGPVGGPVAVRVVDLRPRAREATR